MTLSEDMPRSDFVALDFETASYSRDSACALALVRVEENRIVARTCRLIRPPQRRFHFTGIHGITWNDVKKEPTFAEIWPALQPMLNGVQFLAAHNASFDRSVLRACCDTYRMEQPKLPFLCTVRLARHRWNLRPTRLPDVCRYLDIELNHHDAASDAEACARIILCSRNDAARSARPI